VSGYILGSMSEELSKQSPEEIINRVRPEHQSIQQFEGGDNRDVFVVDGTEVFRFPKNESGVEAGRYEFETLKLVYGRLSVAVPRPIELAPDGSYNVLSFLQGNVLRKHNVTELPFEKRRNLGVAIAGVISCACRHTKKLRARPSARKVDLKQRML
jgi:hypothetical protein